MTDTKTWFVTGAARGMGLDFAKAFSPPATHSSHRAATPIASQVLGPSSNLLRVKLDVTTPPTPRQR